MNKLLLRLMDLLSKLLINFKYPIAFVIMAAIVSFIVTLIMLMFILFFKTLSILISSIQSVL